MLRNKLSHHAYLAIEDETHETIAKFLESLKKTFGPDRSTYYYRGKLSIAYKKQSEHILDYIGRVKDLVTAIIEGDQSNLNRKLTHVETHLIESYALEAFYKGLPSKYRVELKAEGYTNFTDACAKAITIHKRLEKEEARYKNSRNSHEGNLTNTNGNTQTRILQRDNHHGPTDNTNTFDGTRKIYTYCKNFGHLFHECRKRQYHINNPRFDNNNNVNNNNNHNNNSPLTPSKTGNQFEASANGTPEARGITWHRQSLPFKDRESVKIPARTNFGFVIRIANPDIKTRYLPRLRIYDGVFARDSIATCINDKAYVRIINTLEFEIEVLIFTIRLIEIEKISYEPPYNHDTQKQTQQNETTISAEDKASALNHHKDSIESNNADNKNPKLTRKPKEKTSANSLNHITTIRKKNKTSQKPPYKNVPFENAPSHKSTTYIKDNISNYLNISSAESCEMVESKKNNDSKEISKIEEIDNSLINQTNTQTLCNITNEHLSHNGTYRRLPNNNIIATYEFNVTTNRLKDSKTISKTIKTIVMSNHEGSPCSPDVANSHFTLDEPFPPETSKGHAPLTQSLIEKNLRSVRLKIIKIFHLTLIL
ncbi:hypothetical protein ALC57_00475 [Trachymyrmex cornetzi]|uniref:Retrotransposon gag domain-containing protein n=1 Tax=Trachymyrmex cornetzi TaxID=471704 RepID=A0A151JS53_9HYME|nr:hypothetical protein ALC57_00475 [Trachymyrmex cornetzi]